MLAESCLKELESDRADAFDEVAKKESEETPLQMALLSGRIDAAEDLVKSGANIDLKIKGKNLLHLCVEKNMLSSAQLVHKLSDKQIQERDSAGRKVIHVAAENADLSMCEWLVEKGAEVTALSNEKKSSPVHHVGLNVNYGNEDLIHFFKTLGFSLEKRDKEGLTPLHYALRAGNLKVASDMIKLGADLRVESNSLNLLQYCVRHNYLESAKFIHKKDEELIKKVCESGGRTVLHIAAEFADKEMCRWLVSQGASVPTLSGDAENNVLHFTAMNFTHGVALFKYFHTFGIALNARNKFCLSPLHVALERENLKVAEAMLNFGANINMYIDHSNLIHFCAKRNKLDAAKFLHERNQELIKEPCFGGRTTLHTAAQFSTVEFCQWLIEKGVNLKFSRLAKFKMSEDDTQNESNEFPLLSLENMAIGTIVKNIGRYKELITKKISPPMRKVLFERAMERIKEIGDQQVWAALPYLDQHRMTEYFSTRDFPNIFRIENSKGVLLKNGVTMEEFLQFIVQFVPNLLELNIDWSSFHDDDRDIDIKLSGFFDICKECKNLQTIRGEYMSCDMEPQSLKMSLEAFNSQFDCHVYEVTIFPSKIGITFEKSSDSDEPYRSAEASLRNDFLDLIKPNLTHLTVHVPDENKDKKQNLQHILTRFGANLIQLEIYNMMEEDGISLKYIFEHCSSLESLHLKRSNVADDKEELTSYSQLKDFEWSFGRGSRNISLDEILSAPLLEVFYIVPLNFDFGYNKKELFERIYGN
ncbi:Hypothetical predicted protein [Cloeon dipterum]|uniref:Uncharacterized protein n=1 Tax=Cloeon dipterum TaxID=197152 RepID=A0A8S1DNF1_9INSE|nr:Hypothetical predicted protein [Cloeon dipterum]